MLLILCPQLKLYKKRNKNDWKQVSRMWKNIRQTGVFGRSIVMTSLELHKVPFTKSDKTPASREDFGIF